MTSIIGVIVDIYCRLYTIIHCLWTSSAVYFHGNSLHLGIAQSRDVESSIDRFLVLLGETVEIDET